MKNRNKLVSLKNSQLYYSSSLKDLLKENCDRHITLDSYYMQLISDQEEVLKIRLREDQQKNIFDISEDILKSAVTNLAEYILIELKASDFIVKKDGINVAHITPDTLTLIEQKANAFFGFHLNEALGVNDKMEDRFYLTAGKAKYRLISYLISLRLGCEISKMKVPYPLEDITPAIAMADFDKLKDFEQYNLKKESKNGKASFTQEDAHGNSVLSFNFTIGNKAVNRFTYLERAKAKLSLQGRDDGGAPAETFDDPLHLYKLLRKSILEYYKKKYAIKNSFPGNLEDGIDNYVIRRGLELNEMVSQFPPTTLIQLLYVLRHKYGLDIPKTKDNKPTGRMLDPCGGWGGRLLGTFASEWFSHYTVIEPNANLTAIYPRMHQTYAPEKTLTVINKKVEDVGLQEILPNPLVRYHCVFTSPPYMGLENYTASTGNEYWDKSKWNAFKFALFNQGQALGDGGIMVINVASINYKNEKINLPLEFKKFIQKNASVFQLNYVQTLFGSIMKRGKNMGSVNEDGEAFVLARRQPILPALSSRIELFELPDNDEEELPYISWDDPAPTIKDFQEDVIEISSDDVEIIEISSDEEEVLPKRKNRR